MKVQVFYNNNLKDQVVTKEDGSGNYFSFTICPVIYSKSVIGNNFSK